MANITEYNFNTAYTQAKELYGTELDPNEFESIGLIGWSRIGNRNTSLYKYMVHPEQDELGNYYVDLPCNCDIIEAVTTSYEDYQKTSPTTLAGQTMSGWIEGYIESRKFNTNHLYPSGKFIKFRREGDRLFLADRFDDVIILYHGIKADKQGLPLLNEKELDAIAAFCAFSYTRRKALTTRDQTTFQMAQYLELEWKRLCTAARVPEYFDQNEMDQILEVGVSWDRKRFGRSYKPIR